MDRGHARSLVDGGAASRGTSVDRRESLTPPRLGIGACAVPALPGFSLRLSPPFTFTPPAGCISPPVVKTCCTGSAKSAPVGGHSAG